MKRKVSIYAIELSEIAGLQSGFWPISFANAVESDLMTFNV